MKYALPQASGKNPESLGHQNSNYSLILKPAV